jgi:hypothetical protein
MRAAFVCGHIVIQLKDRKPRGAVWSYDKEDDSFTMYCSECEALVSNDGGAISDEHAAAMDPKLICEGCMDEVLHLNGKSRLN